MTRINYALRRDMDASEIARSIAHPCLAALFDNLAMLTAGAGGEALHQARVCVRRLRALLSLLRSAFSWQDEKTVRAELKWLSDLLGGARELDVFVKSGLLPAAEANPDAPGFEPLREAFQRRRDQAYAGVIATLRSPRLLGLSLDLLGSFDGDPNSALLSKDLKRGGNGAAWRCLEKELQRRLKSLVKDSRSIDELAPAEQHRVRIQAKKLRYMLEPFQDHIPQKLFRDITTSLQAIQDALGDINDDGVNRALALAHARDTVAGHGDGQSSLFAAGIVAATCHGCRRESLSKTVAARDRLVRAPALEFG